MTRRTLLAALASAVGVGAWLQPNRWWNGVDLATDADRTVVTYGYLTPDICAARGLDSASARVFLDGVDVTPLRVQACDDRRGYLDILKVNAHGRHYLGPDQRIACERRHGQVRVTFA